MKIALTGGSGSVGRAILEEALRRGHSVVNIDLVDVPADLARANRLAFVQADIGDYDALLSAMSGCDALIHMAAYPRPGIQPDHVIHNTNVVGSYNALRAAAELGITRICQASSVNAIGLSYSREPRFDYFPIDEAHPNYAEDPYSLSKWICEQQADAFVRRYETLRIASMRFHWCVADRSVATTRYSVSDTPKNLWAYTTLDHAADACLLSLEAAFDGHEVFYIVASETAMTAPSLELAAKYYANVPITGDLSGNRSFFSTAKAERLLGRSRSD